MSRFQDLLPPDEELRLARCVREPIHVPGAVQPHGALLAVDVDTLTIRQVSDNTTALLGRTPAELLGATLDVLLEPSAGTRLRLLADAEAANLSRSVRVSETGEQLDALCHRVGDRVVVELEPALPVDGEGLLELLDTTMEQLAAVDTVADLVRRAADILRRATGFDRVMVYRFYEDHHGEVVADDHAEGMDDYLGLHYPASDIPAQARALFLKKKCRAIVDSSQSGVPLVSDPDRPQPALDLSRSELRAVSPHHLQFMANMGQAATMSLSLISQGQLVGMVTCAHREPRRLPYQLRHALVLLANQLTLQWVAITERERLQRQLEIHRIRTALVTQLAQHDPPVDGLVEGEVTLLSLLPADGVTVSFAGEFRSLGDAPPQETATALQTLLRRTHPDDHFSSSALAEDQPIAAALLPLVAGIVFVPLGSGDDAVVWYRREVLQTVNWLGDQTTDNRVGPLSPRNSFTVWKQTVADRSAAWDEAAVHEATGLRTDATDVLLRRTQAQLAHQGLHDDLTGLANRRQAIAWLVDSFPDPTPPAPVAVLFVDIDKFKYVNDSFGHDIGDHMITTTADRLQALARPQDLVARLGGDEFMVALHDVTLPEAQALADGIVAAFDAPVVVHDQTIPMSVSVGLALAGTDRPSEPLDLLREADTAMYEAKTSGGDQVALFEPRLRPALFHRMETERALTFCLERDELVLHYQPIIRLADGRLTGAEALLRWRRPGGRLSHPDEFVPLLEETGMIRAVGAWVLGEAVRQLGLWQRAGAVSEDFSLSVNLSARQFSNLSLATDISSVLDRHGVPPAALTLEITETAAMSDRPEITESVEQVAALGIGLSVDDFGTGYSSMSMLRSLPVTQLKVDKQFVAGLRAGNRHAGLAAAVIDLAHQFHLSSVAEGIEDDEQLSQLRRLGCDFGQGFHLGMPVPAEEFPRVHQPV
jgi:chemotaxis family two-component system sensor kinase Cph1